MLAYLKDTQGDEKPDLFIKNLKTGEVKKELEGCYPMDITWHEDNSGIFYSPAGKEWRSTQIFYHKLGSKDDKLLYEEKDDVFNCSIDKSSDKKYFFLYTSSKSATECYFIDMKDENMKLNLIQER